MNTTSRSKVASIGGIVALFGLVSMILSFFNYNLKILLWIEAWGETVSWVIRVGLIVVGLALYFLVNVTDEDEVTPKREMK